MHSRIPSLARVLLSTAVLLTAHSPAIAGIDANTFAPVELLPTGPIPFQSIAVDVDGDGKLDLVTSNLGDNTVSVLRNLGIPGFLTPASFDTQVTFPVGSGTTGIAAGDIDGDGKSDLITANFNVSTISVLRNTSVSGTINASSLAPEVEFSTGATPAYVSVADLNRDGKLDIIVANQSGSSVSIFRNTSTPGNIAFDPHVDLLVTGGPLSVAVADLDGDGLPEIVSTDINGTTISVLRNISNASSLVFESKIDFFSGTGPINVSIADVDGDGKRDIVVANQNGNTLSVLRNTTSGVGSFTPGSFDTAFQIPTLNTPRRVEVIDVDLDGKPDLITSVFGNNAISVYANRITAPGAFSSSSFALNVDFAVGSGPHVMGVGDLDGDGDIDLIAPNLNANSISVLVNFSSPSPPVILQQPANVSAIVGDPVTFTVLAAGKSPLTYQWLKNGLPISGATSPTFTLLNVQLSQAGRYSVKVTNPLGFVVSTEAILTVSPGPTRLTIGLGAANTGQRVRIPVVAQFNGSENALGFSVSFDSSQLRFIGAEVGRGTPSTMAFDLNTNSAPSGQIGLGIALPGGSTFNARTQAVMVVTFEANATAVTADVPIRFSDFPILRQIADKTSVIIPGIYTDGNVTVTSVGFEGDVSPVPQGDRQVQIVDWAQIGRFAAGLDIPSSALIFQRADCAPRLQRGNGQITVADWVQAGRYATGLDPLTAAAGPTRLGGPPPLSPPLPIVDTTSRTLSIENSKASRSSEAEIPITLDCKGNENAFGFSVRFDPSQVAFVGASTPPDLRGALLNVNSSRAAEGVIGLALALPIGQPAGALKQTLVTLRLKPKSVFDGSLTLSLEDAPALREVVDVYANALQTAFVSGQVQFGDVGPSIRIETQGKGIRISWTVTEDQTATFTLQTSSSLDSGSWKTVEGLVASDGHTRSLSLPSLEAQSYFRLRHN